MKITQALTMFTAAAFAAGCVHEEHHARYEHTSEISPAYSSGRMSDYNTKNEPFYRTGSGAPGTYGTDPPPVALPAGESDNEVTAQVRESLARDPEIAIILPNIQINVNNGAVLLNGSAQGEAQKRQITAIVQRTTGVVTVNNQLKVPAGPNENGNTGGSELNPTGNAPSQRLYKNPGEDEGNDNALNPGTMQNGQDQIYQQNTPVNQQPEQGTNSNSLGPTSRPNSESQIYQQTTNPGNQMQNSEQIQNTNANNQKP